MSEGVNADESGKEIVGSRKQTVILTHNFIPWSYLAVLSSRTYVSSSDETYSTGPRQSSAWSPAATVLYLPTRLTAASWEWLKTKTARILGGHLHISDHSTHTFPFSYVTVSAYFCRCIPCRDSLIDCSVKVQYATNSEFFFP